MNVKRVLSTALLLCLCFSVVVGATQNTGGQIGVARTLSAKTMGKLKLNVGAALHFAQSSDYVMDVASPDPAQISFIQDPAKLFSSNAFLSFGLFNFWDIAAALPFYYDWAGFDNQRDGGMGDLEISAKFMLPPVSFDKLFYQAIFIGVTVPTGMGNSGFFPRQSHLDVDKDTNAGSFYSTDYVTVKPMLLFTFDLGKNVPLQIHLNLGAVFTEINKQNTMIGALALEYAPAEFITMFAEFWGESRWGNFSSGYDIRRDPLYVTPGVRINTPSGLYLFLAGDLSLSSNQTKDRNKWITKPTGGWYYTTGVVPEYGVQFALGWNGFVTVQDRDKDGINDDNDKCPNDPEDLDGFEDADGCPDPDNDKDGICDPWVSEQKKEAKYSGVCKGVDKCPNQPEDQDGFLDEDGCPDLDNDGDGLPDVKDLCPKDREDFDGFQDSDGCPDFDNDKDGVADSVDKCPNDPEDNDGFEDADGCPDIDNDKDGIPDLKDKCPDQPESYNGYSDVDGCPDTIPAQKVKKEPDFPKQQILRGITFRTNTAELTFESFQWLDPIVKALKEYPELEIEVRGYTDGTGKYATNMKLTQMRAEAVRLYLVSQGTEANRVRAVGFGASNPISDNRSAAGRAINRRIEIVRIK
jgi:outer membrane protein OmpA-like peptidoglycan-associated protein